MNINIHTFYAEFNSNYDYLYNNDCGHLESYYSALFDQFVKDHAAFVGAFVNYRGDFISSDREAAAFMITLTEYNGTTAAIKLNR